MCRWTVASRAVADEFIEKGVFWHPSREQQRPVRTSPNSHRICKHCLGGCDSKIVPIVQQLNVLHAKFDRKIATFRCMQNNNTPVNPHQKLIESSSEDGLHFVSLHLASNVTPFMLNNVDKITIFAPKFPANAPVVGASQKPA